MQTNFQAGEGTLSSCLSTGRVPTKSLVSKTPYYLLRVTNKHSTE